MIKIKFKKGRAYPTLISCTKILFGTLFNSIKNNGTVRARVLVPKESLYIVDKTDQADVLKLYGFKSLRVIKPKGTPYSVSYTESMMGFRRKTKYTRYFEFGFHTRIKGIRQKFNPVKVKTGEWTRLPDLTRKKWYHVPITPYFGGHDSNGDGKGGKAPKDLSIFIEFI